MNLENCVQSGKTLQQLEKSQKKLEISIPKSAGDPDGKLRIIHCV